MLNLLICMQATVQNNLGCVLWHKKGFYFKNYPRGYTDIKLKRVADKNVPLTWSK